MSSLIVFGDSLCDGGNAHALRGDAAFPCPPHWRGRRCDGPVWVEQLAERLSLPPLLHSLAGGTNHAYGGARSGAGLSPKGMPNLLEQVAGFLGGEAWAVAVGDRRDPVAPGERRASGLAGAAVAADPLVVIRAGANDYLDAAPGPAVAAAVNGHLLAAVEDLAAAGLRRFLVPTELPWGFSPIELPGVLEADRLALNALISRQNSELQTALGGLAAERQLEVVQPDFHGLFLAVRADPAAFGFDEIHRPVLQSDTTGLAIAATPGAALGDAAAASGYLWWDNWAHLTTAFHGLLADRALAALRTAGHGER